FLYGCKMVRGVRPSISRKASVDARTRDTNRPNSSIHRMSNTARIVATTIVMAISANAKIMENINTIVSTGIQHAVCQNGETPFSTTTYLATRRRSSEPHHALECKFYAAAIQLSGSN